MTEKEIRQAFADNLRICRTKQGLSQMALAEKAGIATNFINDIENCKKWISPTTLEKLSCALHIAPYKLFIPIQTYSQSESQAVSNFSTEVLTEFSNLLNEISKRY